MKKIFKTPEINVYVLDVKDVLNASNDSYYDNELPIIPWEFPKMN